MLDQKDSEKLRRSHELFSHIKGVYLQPDTRAVLINYNVYFRPMNTNFTTSALIEISPVGDIVVHPLGIRLFVLDYRKNRPLLFWIDVTFIFLSLGFVVLFVSLVSRNLTLVAQSDEKSSRSLPLLQRGFS